MYTYIHIYVIMIKYVLDFWDVGHVKNLLYPVMHSNAENIPSLREKQAVVCGDIKDIKYCKFSQTIVPFHGMK